MTIFKVKLYPEEDEGYQEVEADTPLEAAEAFYEKPLSEVGNIAKAKVLVYPPFGYKGRNVGTSIIFYER
jgi:hypothetical protein